MHASHFAIGRLEVEDHRISQHWLIAVFFSAIRPLVLRRGVISW